MFEIFLGSHFEFRVVMAFVLIHCRKCKIKTLIVDGKDRLGFSFPSIEDAVKVTAFCIEHNIPFDCAEVNYIDLFFELKYVVENYVSKVEM